MVEWRHDDATTEHVQFCKRGGAQPPAPAGVPSDYGDVDWGKAVPGAGPTLEFWNFGMNSTWGKPKRKQTSTEINNLIAYDRPAYFLTADNGPHEKGPGPMWSLLNLGTGSDIIQRLGYGAFKQKKANTIHPT